MVAEDRASRAQPSEELALRYEVVCDARATTDLSVVLPCFNVGTGLGDLVVEFQDWFAAGGFSVDYVVVDDGSVDGGTRAVEGWPGVSVLRGENQGKGAAVAAGLTFSQGRVAAFIDGDGAYGADTLEKVCRPVLEGTAFVSVGCRNHRSESHRRAALSKVYSQLVATWYGLDFDTQAGVKAFHRSVLDPVLDHFSSRGFSFDVKVLSKAQDLGFGPVARVPVDPRRTPDSTVNIRRSLEALWDLYRGRGS